jgi:hypothetical protein
MSISNINEQTSKELKVVVVGDGYIGKTWLVFLKIYIIYNLFCYYQKKINFLSMLWSFVYRKFPKDYVPTVFETHAS